MRKYILTIDNKDYKAEIKELTSEHALINVDDKEYKVLLKDLGRKDIRMHESTVPVRNSRPAASAPAPARQAAAPQAQPVASGSGEGVKAPLPGLILEISVKDGDQVKAGQSLIVMEAMKMENQIQAPYDGVVKRVLVKKGDSVAEGDVVIEIGRPATTTM